MAMLVCTCSEIQASSANQPFTGGLLRSRTLFDPESHHSVEDPGPQVNEKVGSSCHGNTGITGE